MFFPMLVFAVVQNKYIGNKLQNFWCVKTAGIITGITLIPVMYYTINGIFGQTPDFINIAIFFVVLAVVYCSEARMFNNNSLKCKNQDTSIYILILIATAYAVLTFVTPRLPFFRDPITGTYGFFG